MNPALERPSIRAHIVLLVLAILLPVAGALAWLLAAEAQLARAAAYEKVRLLATGGAADLQRRLGRADGILGRLTQRPLVRALDPGRCDPIVAEYTRVDLDFALLVTRDARGAVVCASVPDPIPRLDPHAHPWFEEALRAGGFHAGGAMPQQGSGPEVTMLSQPIRNDLGVTIGVLVLPVDLRGWSRSLAGAATADAVVSVFDHDGTLLLRLPDAPGRTGPRPEPSGPQVWPVPREGFLSATDRDGVTRLSAVATVPGVGWQVVAGLPESEVFAVYQSTLRRAAAISLAALLAVLALAWRFNVTIVGPIAALARAASRVGGGETAVRAEAAGPVEIAEVGRQFNRMLDARDAAEAALRESEARYRSLVNWSPEAISVHRDGKVVFVNQACVELLGAASAEALVGTASIDAVHPDFRAAAQEQVAEISASGGPGTMREATFVRADGIPVQVEVRGMPIVYAGEPALFASMRDITARKRAENALRVSESRLRGIFDSATDAIITTDEDQRIVQANPAAAQLFGCPLEALIGAPLDRFIPARFRDRHRHDVRDFGNGAVSMRHMGVQRAVVALRADGTEFPIEASISHLNVAGKRLYTVIHRDITQRREAEAAVRESESRLRTLLAMLPDAVFVNTGNRISYVNEAAQRLFGADEAALLGRSALELIHPESVAQLTAHFAALRAGDPNSPLSQVKIVRADGAIRVAESAATLIHDHGETSILVVLRDVSEYVLTRNALAQSHADLQRLVAAQDSVQEQERKRIARELHDDLQQTLAAIKIDLAALDQQLPPAAAAARPLLTEIDELAASALESTRRIVNDLRPQMLEDLGLVPALESMAAHFSRRTGIACHVEAQDLADDSAWESPTLATCLFRVAQEALGNVAKHAQASEVRLTLTALDGQVTLRIRDDGKGLRSGDLEKARSFGLLGMRERVRAFGGTLHIDSLPAAGTTIEAVVPAANAAPAPKGDALALSEGAKADSAEVANALGPVAPLLQGLIDALAGSAAVFDRHGVIQVVNRQWRENAQGAGDPDLRSTGPGANYLDVCRRSAPTDPDARRVLEGLTALLDGKIEMFHRDYPCHAPDARRWFRMHAAPMTDGRILVTHYELTGEPGDPASRRA